MINGLCKDAPTVLFDRSNFLSDILLFLKRLIQRVLSSLQSIRQRLKHFGERLRMLNRIRVSGEEFFVDLTLSAIQRIIHRLFEDLSECALHGPRDVSEMRRRFFKPCRDLRALLFESTRVLANLCEVICMHIPQALLERLEVLFPHVLRLTLSGRYGLLVRFFDPFWHRLK
jgi:hypothetical protein